MGRRQKEEEEGEMGPGEIVPSALAPGSGPGQSCPADHAPLSITCPSSVCSWILTATCIQSHLPWDHLVTLFQVLQVLFLRATQVTSPLLREPTSILSPRRKAPSNRPIFGAGSTTWLLHPMTWGE